MTGPHIVFLASLLAAAACGYVIGAWRHSQVRTSATRTPGDPR